MARIVFMGTPSFSCPVLEALFDHHEVVCIMTQPDRMAKRGLAVQFPAVKQCAQKRGFPLDALWQFENIHTPEVLLKLQSLKPDFIVVMAYGKILKPSLLAIPHYGCINIHGSLLPRWRGASPIQAALLAGDTVTGVCSMQMAPKMDAGALYLSASTPIAKDDHAQSLHDRLSVLAVDLLLKTLQGIETGTLFPKEQDPLLVTFCQKLTRKDSVLSFMEPAETLALKIRAFYPWPGSAILFSQKRLIIKKASVVMQPCVPAGQLLVVEEGLFFGTVQGALKLEVLHWEGKKPVGACAFIAGWRSHTDTCVLFADPLNLL